MKFLLWLFVAIGVAASLYLSYQIGTQAILVGSREGSWFYFYLASFRPTILLASVAAAATGLAALYLSDRVGQANEWLVVLVWFVPAMVIEVAICSLAPFSVRQDLGERRGQLLQQSGGSERAGWRMRRCSAFPCTCWFCGSRLAWLWGCSSSS